MRMEKKVIGFGGTIWCSGLGIISKLDERILWEEILGKKYTYFHVAAVILKGKKIYIYGSELA